jgi:hypothetical protein
MKRSRLIYILFFFLGSFWAKGQDLEQGISLAFHNQPLGEILTEISVRYDVHFTYSRDFIPLEQPVSVEVENYPLYQTLDLIFAQTPVVYKSIGGHIVLSVDESKDQQLSQLDKLPLPDEIRRKKRLREYKEPQKLPNRNTQIIEHAAGGDRVIEIDPTRFSIPEITHEPYQEEAPVLSIALYSMKRDWDQMEDIQEAKVLIDVLGGNHKKIDGLNIGGGVNNIHHSVRGVQLAGLGNRVNEDVKGIQAAGLFNEVNGKITGLQASGLYNNAGDDVFGMQVAGAANIAKGKADVQVAGLFNYTGGQTKSQVSGLMNIAGDVDWSQTSSLFNKGKTVKGFQLGLINVADTSVLGSYGLLNFIRRGYNRVEISGSDVLHANIGFKLGTRQFYNIFHFGARWDKFTGGDQQGAFMSWGLGYGLGTTLTLGSRSIMNIEAVAIHLNELEPWTNELNLLNQLKFTYDIRLGRKISMFAGPVVNVHVSRLQSVADPALSDVNFAPYTIFDGDDGKNNVKMWVGFQAGFRF